MLSNTLYLNRLHFKDIFGNIKHELLTKIKKKIMKKIYNNFGLLFAICFFAFASQSVLAQDCTWTVSVLGTYGDEVSWELRNDTGNPILTGGPYTYGFTEVQTVEASGPLEFYIEAIGGTWGDNLITYYISNENGIVATGTVTATLEVTKSNLSCSDQAIPFSAGCLNAIYAPEPIDIITPLCVGIDEVINANAYGGQFSLIQLSAGVEYHFSSSLNTDYITVSDEEGNAILVHGEGSVSWTSDVDRVVRFYTHIDAYCNYNPIFRERRVRCGEALPDPVVPDFDCYQGDGLASNNFENAFSIGVGPPYRNADDFVVAEGTNFNLSYIRLNIATFTPVSDIFFVIYQDNNGKPSNTIFATTETVVPTEQLFRGNNNLGFPIFEVSADFTNQIAFPAGRYWLMPQANILGFGDPYWEMTSTGSNGNFVHSSEFDGPWVADARDYNAVFYVAGECNDSLGVNDINNQNVSLYPNPTSDIVTIESNKGIDEVEVFNIAGQKMKLPYNSKENKLSFGNLNSGIYILKVKFDDGSVIQEKIVKQ